MKKTLLTVFLLTCTSTFFSLYAQIGTWTALTSQAPDKNQGVMLLLTDGTVICHTQSGGGEGTGWDKLTPDIHGSYVNGTWTTLASNTYDRLFFSSQVLPSGKVYVAGGEYGHGDSAGEVYDPVANSWALCGALPKGSHNKTWQIYDGNSDILANGDVLQGVQIGSNPSFDNLFYNPTTNVYTAAPASMYNHDEAQWLKLPDNSILFVGIASTQSNRYIPASNTWVNDGTVPVNLYDTYGEEAGSAFMLPNGKAIFFGATPHTAIYTPTGTTSPGSWVAGPDFPTIGTTQVGMTDASSAMMVNGHILCAVSPIGTGSGDEFRTPTYFVEYNYATNAFTQVTSIIPLFGADSIAGLGAYLTNMLPLPDGNILFSFDQTSISQYYWIYTPGSAAIAAGKPTISAIIPDACPSYKLTGKLFNGISEGAAYGDDWQMETNYPIVRLTNGANVYYAKTTYWNRVGAVQTDSLADTVIFTPPASLPAGTYSLVVVANGFASNPTIFKTLGITIASKVNNSCDISTGSVTANAATGGVSPYTYSWSPSGGTNLTASNLTANTYTITVTDGSGCTATASATITQPASALGITMSTHTNASCNGGTGSATANAATGGTSPYSYSWSPGGGTNLTASNLTANTYTITATDANSCTATASATITQPLALSTTASVTANVNCNGGSTGNASASPSNGTAPYTYTWSNGTSTVSTSNPTGATLSAGGYTVTVKDNCGATQTAAVTISQPIALATTASVTANVGCNGGSTGNASASPSNGNSPYTYSWSNGTSTVSTSNPTGAILSAGVYTVTVKDNCGATQTAAVTITQPVALSTTASVTANVSCRGGSSGNASASPGNGNAPYTYSWVNSSSTVVSTSNPTGSILPAGGYTVTVKDNCGATQTAAVTITQPASLTTSATVLTNVNCNSSGNASANASGGTAPYTYTWSNGTSTVSTSNPSGPVLLIGNYTVTVRDNCSATATASVTITQSNAVVVNWWEIHNVSCFGGSNGVAISNVYGGTLPYTYSWSPNTSDNTGESTTLSQGTYTITVEDNNGCTGSNTVTISQPASAVNETITHNSDLACHSVNNGSATSNPSGGTPPYSYSWLPSGGTAQTSHTLPGGTDECVLSDNNGCIAKANVIITSPPAISATITKLIPQCYGNSNGAVTASGTGGISPYTYVWAHSLGNTAEISGLSTGTYTVTVTDNTGCSGSANVGLGQPSALSVTYTATACSAGKETATAIPSGGTGPYKYAWSNGTSNISTIIHATLTEGTYTLTLNDAHSCPDATIDISCTCPPSVIKDVGLNKNADNDDGNNLTGITIYPNPTNGQFTISASGGSINREQLSVEIYNVLGERVYVQFLIPDSQFLIDISSEPNGIYLIRILDKDGNLVGMKKVVKTN